MWNFRVPLIVAILLLSKEVICKKNNEHILAINKFFNELNMELMDLNRESAKLSWDLSMDLPNASKLQEQFVDLADLKLKWQSLKCEQMKGFGNKLNVTQHRMYQLYCRGPKYTRYQAKELMKLSSHLQMIYTNTEICVPKGFNICQDSHNLWNVTFVKTDSETMLMNYDGETMEIKHQIDLQCFTGEPDLERLMTGDFSSISDNQENNKLCKTNEEVIWKWIWESWHMAIGPAIKEAYPDYVNLLNIGAKNNGYEDIGVAWREELEVPDLERVMKGLIEDIEPFYRMLHAFTVFMLQNKYDLKSTLPAHLLGWNQNWNHLFQQQIASEIFSDKFNIENQIKSKNWSPEDMLKRSEDFYSSLGLDRMPKKFWTNSFIGKKQNGTHSSCHGTAANMYNKDDYRMIVCAEKSLYDFYVIVHEMGHLQQYMLVQNQPAVFQDGHSAIQEAIGDSIFLGVITPMHLSRLQLIKDQQLFPSTKNSFDLYHLMTMAFMKIPQIPFEFIFDKFRWNLFSNRVSFEESNDYFWDLSRKFQEITPPDLNFNRHDLFDAAGKFHLAANVPYVRYFFASFMQAQIFKGLCEITVYGKLNSGKKLPMPLAKCDIYGSKKAGNLLKKALKPGSSIHWSTILLRLSGTEEITSDALLEYYEPLIIWLKSFLDTHNVKY